MYGIGTVYDGSVVALYAYPELSKSRIPVSTWCQNASGPWTPNKGGEITIKRINCWCREELRGFVRVTEVYCVVSLSVTTKMKNDLLIHPWASD